jgi:DNA polymerase
MDIKHYQKNILLELMNLEEFKLNDSNTEKQIITPPKEISKKVNLYSSTSIGELEKYLNQGYNLNSNLIEGNVDSKILFFFGKCHKKDQKILDNKSGELFDRMLSSIKLDRSNVCLASYIPRGLENLYDDEEFLTQIQMVNYRLIEIVNPKFLIIMSNYCIKMLLATDLSSMSLRGKWFDFNTANDTTPKKCRVLYEPEILLNNPELKKDAWEDLKEIQKQLGG